MWFVKLFRRQTPCAAQKPPFQSAGITGPPGIPQNGYETCVLCGQVTPVRFETPVDARKYYIEGCGQLCRRCFIKL